MKYKFNIGYFIWTVVLLITEIGIGFFVKDQWIRPFFGDFLVVIFLYCLCKSFLNISVNKTIFGVLIFSYAIEILQFFHYVEILGLQNNKVASILLGTYFSWIDMLMYSLGLLAVFVVEKLRMKSKSSKNA